MVVRSVSAVGFAYGPVLRTALESFAPEDGCQTVGAQGEAVPPASVRAMLSMCLGCRAESRWPMKIAFLSVLPPPGQPAVSGVYRVSQTLLRQFESVPGIEVEAITLIDGLSREIVTKDGNVRYHYLPCKKSGKTLTFYCWEIMRLKRRLRMLGVDIVHGQPTSEYLLAATGVNLPHVITIHGLLARESAVLARWQPGWVAAAIREFLNRKAIKRAQHIISISSYVDEYVGALSKGVCWPIPNPIEAGFFKIIPAERNGLRILCVGIISERKNQLWLIEACSELAVAGVPFECRIIGRFSPGYEDVIRKRVAASSASNHISVVGPVEEKELLDHYAWSNAIVLPSREETAPLSLIQGMACRRPVFGARSAGIPRLLGDGIYGTLFPLDHPCSLARQLQRYIQNGDPFWELADRSHVYALKQFDPAMVAMRTIQLYRSIISEPDKNRAANQQC
jgi:glycosyltransferase involved in cell wall biosynthesis